ncbi:hypothetical protein JTB14_009531 [Gonioctena quinquepunctata]|nr:hypothetical protein JTB14_009531 [Gonioctena quinquepunctata]
MDSDDDELLPIVNDSYRYVKVFQYNDPLLVSGVLRAVVTEDLDEIRHLIKSGQSVNINDNNGNTPLHVAVIKKNFHIVEFLIAQEDIVINARNSIGQTPLFLAVRDGAYELVKFLVDNGANVNLPNYEDVTPLHVSIQYPNIAHILITNGANINASDYSDDTPLHDAVEDSYLETVCMLVYYNADANRPGGNNSTPFMNALMTENHALQEALFEYVDDFNISTFDGISTLALALTHDNPFVEEIINRGADVDILAYKMCLRFSNPQNFKLIWKKLSCQEVRYVSLLELGYLLDEIHEPYFQDFLEIIMEDSSSAVLAVIAENLSSRDLALLVEKYAHCHLSLDNLTKLTCLLLQYGFQMSSFVIYEIFANFGYCELFKILLFMDYVSEWTPFMITSRLIFDIKSNIKTRCNEIISVGDVWIDVRQLRDDAKKSLEYWVYHPIIDVCQNQFHDEHMFDLERDGFSDLMHHIPKIPSLLQLARDKTREHIVDKLKLSTTCQYYTVINHLNISYVYKEILMFQKKLYKFC